MTNSTWTCDHIKQIWKTSAEIVYPPCAVNEFLELHQASDTHLFMNREKIILSIGQFRPEKDHPLQLKAFAKFLELNPKFKAEPSYYYNRNLGDEDSLKDFDNKYPVICLLGSCRDSGDESRVKELRLLAKKLGIQGQVKFQINADFSTLKNLLSRSLIGIHTMWNEHFGIGVVEFMVSCIKYCQRLFERKKIKISYQ